MSIYENLRCLPSAEKQGDQGDVGEIEVVLIMHYTCSIGHCFLQKGETIKNYSIGEMDSCVSDTI